MNKLTALAAMAAGCLSASAALDSTCYSQKGLVGHWDGIENLARGVHDASTRTWKDLAGGIGDGNLGEAVTWTDTGWSNDANGHPVIVPGTKASALLSTVAEFTFSFDFAVTPSRSNVQEDFAGTGGNGSNVRILHNFNGKSGLVRYNFNGTTQDSTDKIDANEQTTFCLAFTRALQRSYKNGLAFAIPQFSSYNNILGGKEGFGIGCSVVGNESAAMRGLYHGFRFYNRAISEEEAKLNACVDKVRFFGADPTSLTWPTGYAYVDGKLSMQATVAAYPEGRGSVAVGGDAASEAFSGSIEAGTTLVAVPAAGYRFAHWSDELGNRYGESATITVPFGVTELYAVFEDLPVTSGLAVHLDATDGAFLETDASGSVTAWQDIGNLANVFTTNDWNATFADSVPRYDPTAFDGQGAVRFGRKPDGTFTPTGLISSQFLLTNKTVFIVFRRDPDADGSTVPGWNSQYTGRDHLLSRYTINTWISSVYAAGVDGWYVVPAGAHDGNSFWLCGQRILDTAHHYTNSLVTTFNGASNYIYYDKTRGRNQIVAARNDPAAYESATKSLWIGSATDTSSRMLCLGHCGSKNYETQMFVGWIAEVVTYDRALPDDEFLRVQNALIDKWDVAEDDGAGFVWAGAAGNGLWSDSRNWDRGRVPGGDCGLLCIPDNAEITVDGTFGCGTLFLGTNVKMTIADGAVFNVSAGQRLELPDVVGCSGTVKVTGGGTLVLSNAAGGEFLTATLCLDGADLDVNGGRYVFRSVTATSGAVVNSAVATGTVGVCAPAGGASVFGAFAKGNVNVVKVGPGEVALTGFSAHRGETRFSSGAATVSGTTLPSLGSLSLHLDAQDLASVVTNEDGTVAEWKDLTGVGNAFTASTWNATRPYSLPRYDPAAFDGRGGVRFGWCTTNPEFPDGVYTQTCLTCTKPVLTNLTIFVVVRLDPDATSENCPRRNANREYVMSRVVASSWDASINIPNAFGSWQLNPSTGGDQTAFWYNGRKYLDMPNGFKDPAVKASTGTTPNPYYVSGLEKRGTTQLMVFRTTQTAYVNNYSSLWIGNGTSSTFVLGRCGAKFDMWEYNMLAGWIGEIVTYPRALSDDEVCRVERVLIEKWGVTDSLETPPAPNNPLSSASTLVLEKGAELDLAGATQTVAAVAFGGGEGTGAAVVTNGVLETSTLTAVAEADGTLPLLKICGDWSLADKSLTITGYDRKPRSGTLLQTSDGVFGGKFSAVSGNGALPVRYRSQKVGLGGDGLLMLLR